MPERRFSVTPYRVLLFLATVFTLTSWIFLIDSNLFSQRAQFQESDYIMTFYVAGSLVAAGRSGELYPRSDAPSFIDSPFDRAAHALLPRLPKSTTGAYMYIPLVAGFFVPFSYLDPNWSLLIWQMISVLALGLSCKILACVSQAKSREVFFLSFLFAPVFLTLWAGQLGLGFGLLPLCVGYLLILRQRHISGGLFWSLLLLKPQFLLAGGFVAITLVLTRDYRAFFGMAIGVVSLIMLTVITFGNSVMTEWLLSHQVSDATYSSGLHGIPTHLITGLPANLMILLPVSQRSAAKLPLYTAAAGLWIFGLGYCYKIGKIYRDQTSVVTLSLIIGLLLCAVTLPHLLYYDLCLLLPVGVLLLGKKNLLYGRKQLRWIAIIGWIVVSGFLPILLAFSKFKALPLTLETILLILFVYLLWHARQNPTSLEATHSA